MRVNEMKTNYFSSRGIILFLSMLFISLICMSPVSAFGAGATDGSPASNLNTTLTSKLGSNTYQLKSGGYATGSQLITNDGLVTSKFKDLTSSEQSRLLQDMVICVDNKIEADKNKTTSGAVTDGTKTDWLSQLQTCSGVGSQLLNTVLAQTKPDYVTANRIYAPFSGLVGTCLGVGAVVIMAALALTMVVDIAYITIPAFRLSSEKNGNGGGKGSKPFMVSDEAASAISQAEDSGGQGDKGGVKKVALFTYFKSRVISLVALGVCLLYLIQGQIFTFVGMVLDLVSGLVGF